LGGKKVEWLCPYTNKPQTPGGCLAKRTSRPIVGITDYFQICQDCSVDLPLAEVDVPENAETSTCAISQTDPSEVEEVMESVEKSNGDTQASPVIFSPQAERIAAKSRMPTVSFWKKYQDLPNGSEWIGTACGHVGRKGIDFFETNYSRCKKCVIQKGKELRAKEPPKSYPIVPLWAQEESLMPETMIDAPKPEVPVEVPKTAFMGEERVQSEKTELTIVVPTSLTLQLPPLSTILIQVPSSNIKDWIIKGLIEAEEMERMILESRK
jgi:hypothetical protein